MPGDGPASTPRRRCSTCTRFRAELGRLDGLRVAMVGDLSYGRTVRSLSYLLALYREIELIFVAPPEVAMREDIKGAPAGARRGLPGRARLKVVLPGCDVSTRRRIQKERFRRPAGDYERASARVYIIEWRGEWICCPPIAIVMHPPARRA